MWILKKLIAVSMVGLIAVAQCGCSVFAGSRQTFSVTTSEPDAQIFINGDMVGVGTARTSVRRDQTVSVMAKKEGYYPASRDIGTSLGTLGILDIIGGCIWLLPFIGLASPGSHALDQNAVSLILQKESVK